MPEEELSISEQVRVWEYNMRALGMTPGGQCWFADYCLNYDPKTWNPYEEKWVSDCPEKNSGWCCPIFSQNEKTWFFLQIIALLKDGHEPDAEKAIYERLRQSAEEKIGSYWEVERVKNQAINAYLFHPNKKVFEIRRESDGRFDLHGKRNVRIGIEAEQLHL